MDLDTGKVTPLEIQVQGPRVTPNRIAAALAECRRDGIGFLDALQRYIFCGLGKGCVDLPGFVEGLRRASFAGWMVVEEDTSPDVPLVAARRNRRYLEEVFGI